VKKKPDGQKILEYILESGIKHGRMVTKSGGSVAATCKHRRSGACGGCYARLYWSFIAIEQGQHGAEVVRKVFAIMANEQGEAA